MASYMSLREDSAESIISFIGDSVAGREIEYNSGNDNYNGYLNNLHLGLKKQGLKILKTNKGPKVFNSIECSIIKILNERGIKFSSLNVSLVNYSCQVRLLGVFKPTLQFRGIEFREVQNNTLVLFKGSSNAIQGITGLSDFVKTLESLYEEEVKVVSSQVGKSSIFN